MQMLRMLWPSCCPPNWDPWTMLSNIWTRQIVAIPLPLCPGIRGFWCWESSLGSKRILQDFLWDWCGSETVKWANVNEQDWPVISNMFQLKAPNLRTRTRLQVGDVVSWQVSVLTWACPCINVTIWPVCTAGSTVLWEVCRWSSPSAHFAREEWDLKSVLAEFGAVAAGFSSGFLILPNLETAMTLKLESVEPVEPVEY